MCSMHNPTTFDGVIHTMASHGVIQDVVGTAAHRTHVICTFCILIELTKLHSTNLFTVRLCKCVFQDTTLYRSPRVQNMRSNVQMNCAMQLSYWQLYFIPATACFCTVMPRYTSASYRSRFTESSESDLK